MAAAGDRELTYKTVAENRHRLPLTTLCDLFGVSRGAFYHYQNSSERRSLKKEKDYHLVRTIEKIIKVFYGYGYRRVTQELFRRDVHANHKKVLSLMRKNGLLCKRKGRFIKTTDSTHNQRIYPNLIKRFTLTGLNQLWVADITYIRLVYDFCYLATIMDVFSRKIVSWYVCQTIDHRLVKEALKIAISKRSFGHGLIHHSDQGIQYACRQYVDILKANKIAISMSRKGNPYDNAYAESFFATLKKEEVNISEYETFDEAKRSIHAFIDKVYNQKRLHSSLDYIPPVEFEENYQQLEYQLN